MEPTDRNAGCPICGGNRFDTVHRQDFILPGDVQTHYVVVTCRDCGFAFARDLPGAEEYESYYRTNLRYTYEGSRGAAEALFAIHQGSFELVDRHLSHAKESRILDVGCSTGELLALFQRAGYTRLTGVDPTPECREIAKRLHGVEVTTAVLSEISAEQPYDVVLLANVLEHIPNLRQAMRHVSSVLRSGGLLFVPDGVASAVNPKHTAEPPVDDQVEFLRPVELQPVSAVADAHAAQLGAQPVQAERLVAEARVHRQPRSGIRGERCEWIEALHRAHHADDRRGGRRLQVREHAVLRRRARADQQRAIVLVDRGGVVR